MLTEFLSHKLERTRPPRRRRQDNIKMDFREMGWLSCYLKSSGSAGCCEQGNEPLGSIKDSVTWSCLVTHTETQYFPVY
jgi:hypothetical protein